MKNILITGSKGQLAADCLDVFKDASGVTGLDLPEVDLSDRSVCFSALDRARPEIIINCAAYTAVDACETDQTCWKANADLPANLAEWAKRNGAFLIHVSTDYVFPGNKPLYQAATEDDVTGPVSEYGRSKLAGEQRIAEQTDRFAVLRTAWLYGATGKNFLKTMLRLTLQNPGKELRVVNDQFGSPTWSYTLARQIRAVAEKPSTGIFHATSEGYGSWYDLACAFLDELNISHCFVPCASDEYPTPAKRPLNSILENSRLKQLEMNRFADWREELKMYVKQCGATVLKEVRTNI